MRLLWLTIPILLALPGCNRNDTPDPVPVKVKSEAPAEAPAPEPQTQTPTQPRDPRTVPVMYSGPPPVAFDPPETAFGILPPAAEARGSVRLSNLGDEPLTVMRSITSCGCTTADDLTGRVIPPGQSTTFNVAMKMKSGLGKKKEKITIWFEGYPPRQPAIYYFNAEVSLPVRVTPPYITATQVLQGALVVESQDGEPFRILATHGDDPVFLDSYDPATDTPRPGYTIRWDLTERDRAGTVPWFWVIETDRPDCPLVDVRVRHDSTRPVQPPGRPWVPKQQRLLVGIVQPGVPLLIEPEIEYSKRFEPDVTSALIRDEATQFTATLTEPTVEGQFLRYRIKVVPNPDHRGLMYDTIRLGASGFETDVSVIGKVP